MSFQSPRISWVLRNCSGKSILDVGFAGSEEKYPTLFLKLRETFPKKKIIGLDINKDKVKSLNLPDTLSGDGNKLPFRNDTFDCVILAEILEHQPDPTKTLSETYRVLKPKGILLLTTPNPFGFFRYLKRYLLSRNPTNFKNVRGFLEYHDHRQFYDPLSLANILYEVGFRSVDYTAVNPSYPYLPEFLRQIQWDGWPFNRIGTTSCFRSVK